MFRFWSSVLILLCGPYQLVNGQHRSPKITEHPKDVLVTKHEPTTLNCKAEGKPDPIIEWYKNGELLGPSSEGRRIFLPFGDLFFLSVSDGRKKDFGPDGSKESDSGTYWCVARNSVGTVQSRNSTLQVGVIRDEFRVLPTHTKALVGETTKLMCQPPRGTPEPQVLWHRNGQTLDTRQWSSRLQIVDGGNLIVKEVQPGDAGRYQCVAINIAGTRTSPEVTLAVDQKPYFKEEPSDFTALIGVSAVFNCDFDGIPNPTVEWFREDGVMPKDRTERVLNGLRIREVRTEDEGTYVCQGSNEVGSVRARATLTVYSRPKFITRPRSLHAGLNEPAKFECSAIGSPQPLIYWRKENSEGLLLPSTSNNLPLHWSLSPEGTLTITGVRKEDLGTFICSAVSPAGSAQAVARLELSSGDALPPPIINVGPRNQTLPFKSMVAFPCEAIGRPVPTIKWMKDGNDLSSKESESRIVLAPNGTLQINDLRSSDAGLYTCVASSSTGSSFASATLMVESPTNPNIAFHRSNPSLVPMPPSRPIVNESTATSITMTWTWLQKQAPARNSPLLGFTLEMFSPDEPQNGWRVLARRLYGDNNRPGEFMYTVEGLQADTQYIFLLRAENTEGLSPAAQLSEIMRTRSPFRRTMESDEVDEDEVRSQLGMADVQLISAESTSSTSIRVMWKVSKNSIKFIDGYYVRYREIVPASEGLPFLSFNLVTVVAHRTDTYSYEISNLKKYIKYELFLAPFYKSMEGPPSNSKIAFTFQDKPSAPPQGLVVTKVLNATSIIVQWSPPPSTHANGVFTGYRVELRGNDSRIHSESDVGANTTSLILNSLTTGSSYTIRLCAFTVVGEGPYSPPLPFVMIPPSSIDSFDVKDVNSTETGNSSEILKEVWFIIFIGFLLFIFLLFLIIVLYNRRKSHGKKDHISSVIAPHNNSQFVSGKQSLWLDQRWGPGDAADKESNPAKAKLLTSPDTRDMTEAPDYTEVDPYNLTSFYNSKSQAEMLHLQQADLTPYATTTLIQRRLHYEPLPTNVLEDYRDSDQFSSGRSKVSFRGNNFNKLKSPSPSTTMEMMPNRSRMGSYPSPIVSNRSHNNSILSGQLPKPVMHPYSSHQLPQVHAHATENLYHIGEIFNPKASTPSTAFRPVDLEQLNFIRKNPLTDREIQSSLPSLASDPNLCDVYAEAGDVIPETTANNYILNNSGTGKGRRTMKNSRSSSPACSTDSFNSGKCRSKRLQHKGTSRRLDPSSKSLERRHLTPLLPKPDDSIFLYNSSKPSQPGFNSAFSRPPPSEGRLLDNNVFVDWQNTDAAIKMSQTLKESNA